MPTSSCVWKKENSAAMGRGARLSQVQRSLQGSAPAAGLGPSPSRVCAVHAGGLPETDVWGVLQQETGNPDRHVLGRSPLGEECGSRRHPVLRQDSPQRRLQPSPRPRPRVLPGAILPARPHRGCGSQESPSRNHTACFPDTPGKLSPCSGQSRAGPESGPSAQKLRSGAQVLHASLTD